MFRTLLACCLLLALTNSLQLAHQVNSTIPCPPPGFFNATTLTCTCLNSSVINPSTGHCICPPSFPWLNNNVCSPCSYPAVFENSTNSCYQCPNGYTYDLVVGYCIQINCPSGFVYNASINNCSCPATKPYFYNNTCNLCPHNSYISNSGCTPCWNGSVYNISINGCQCNETDGFFPVGPATNSCQTCYNPHYFNKK